MIEEVSRKKWTAMMLCGILGCILMGTSDWLMIYGDTTYEGSLAWLTVGVANIPGWRNSLAMALAFPAVIFYSIALFGIKHRITNDNSRTIYSGLTAVGLTPWLCLHLFYVMILYAFAWLQNNGYPEVSFQVSEAVFGHLSWIILLAETLMLLPFFYWFYLVLTKKSRFPKWMAINNPLIIYVVLKLLTGLMPDVPARLAFTNGLMSESMMIWFVLLMLVKPTRSR